MISLKKPIKQKIKKQACKPGSVPEKVSIIYLVRLLPIGSSGLPPGIVRAALIRETPELPVYMALQLMRRTAFPVTRKAVGSYPAFSPLPKKSAVIFCYVAFVLTDNFPLGSMTLFVARTFLFFDQRNSDRTACFKF